MRISLSKKFIFLANPRCGSTSLRKSLDPWSDVRGTADWKPLHHHASLCSVQRYLEETSGLDLEEFFVFTTVRNPWDRVVSIYHYGLSNPRSIWHKPAVESGSVGAFCFQDVLDWHFAPSAGHPEGPYDIRSFTSDAAGARRCKVVDLGNLPEIETALRCRGVPLTIPHVNATTHTHYCDYFDDRARDRIAELFAVDIDEMKYDFNALKREAS